MDTQTLIRRASDRRLKTVNTRHKKRLSEVPPDSENWRQINHVLKMVNHEMKLRGLIK